MRLSVFWALAGPDDELFSDEIVTEFLALQLRSTLELIAISAFVANRTAYEDAFEKLRAHMRLRSVVRNLKAIHANFFPWARRFTTTFFPDGSRQHHGAMPPDDLPILTENELLRAHERCNNSLHIRNPFVSPLGSMEQRRYFLEIARKSENLMEQHVVHLAGISEKRFVHLNYGEKRSVHVFSLSPQ